MTYRSESERPASGAPSSGQSSRSAFVDVVYFLVIGLLGYARMLSEPTLAVLLGSYSSYRFGVAQGKQQLMIALSKDASSSSSSSSQNLPAQRPPMTPPPLPREEPREDRPWQPPTRERDRR